MKIIVYVEHGVGGTKAWINTDVEIDECIVVDGPSWDVAGEESMKANTILLDGPYCCDGFDMPLPTEVIEKRMQRERDDQRERDEAAE